VRCRLSEQLFEPIQADRVLADLRHQPEATAPTTALQSRCGYADGRSAE
jgi:hypothetical protein